MKKTLLLTTLSVLLFQSVLADENVFDSMDKAIEVKLAPSITSNNANATTNVNSVSRSTSLKEEKFNSALDNLDDAQVELRQELAETTSKYNVALIEKEKAVQNCKALKKEIRDINKKMKNVDKSKKIINKNLETTAK